MLADTPRSFCLKNNLHSSPPHHIQQPSITCAGQGHRDNVARRTAILQRVYLGGGGVCCVAHGPAGKCIPQKCTLGQTLGLPPRYRPLLFIFFFKAGGCAGKIILCFFSVVVVFFILLRCDIHLMHTI